MHIEKRMGGLNTIWNVKYPSYSIVKILSKLIATKFDDWYFEGECLLSSCRRDYSESVGVGNWRADHLN